MFKSKEILIGSSLTELYKVEEFVEIISDVYNINSNYYSTILMSLDEAVRNAIEHGNKFDTKKKVTISFTTNKGELVFTVKDEGTGFNLSTIPDPTDPNSTDQQDPKKGLFLMQHLSDRVMVDEQKSEVALYFKVSSITKDMAVQRITALKDFFKENKQTIKA